MTTEQAEYLVRCMVEVAQAAIEDHEYRHSDYGGMAVSGIRKDMSARLEKLFNEAH